MSFVAEAWARSLLGRVGGRTGREAGRGLSIIERKFFQRIAFFTGGKSYNTRPSEGARAARKSLWVDDEETEPEAAQGRGQGRAGKGWEERSEGQQRWARGASEWEDDIFRGAKSTSRPQQRGYIDEWGSLGQAEAPDEALSRTPNAASTSYGKGSRARPRWQSREQDGVWEGEWGQYRDKVEGRTPGGEQRDSGKALRGDFGGRERSGGAEAFWDDDGEGTERSDRGPYQRRQRNEREFDRPAGISKYDEKNRRGGRRSTFDGNGRDNGREEGPRRSDGYSPDRRATVTAADSSRPERQPERLRDQRSRGRGDSRRGWEEEEEGPLVKGGIELQGEVLYGVAPVQAAIRAGKRELFTLYVQENLRSRKKNEREAVDRIKREAQAAGAEIREASKHTLNLLADNRPHQGFVLDAAPLAFISLDELPPPPETSTAAAPAPVWVALDEVVDPQNFGAVLRSASFLGAAGILTCDRNSSPLTAVVSKASAGAVEAINVHSCRNMPDTLTVAVQDGWRVLGASADATAPLVTELPKHVPTVIVLGNEGVGLRTNVRKACSGFVRIAGLSPAPQRSGPSQDDSGNESEGEEDGEESSAMPRPGSLAGLDSLNVSVAAGILLHELLAPRSS